MLSCLRDWEEILSAEMQHSVIFRSFSKPQLEKSRNFSYKIRPESFSFVKY
uniref:Uncharacterized protein n=1 Tax=Arundo donax TaxID=35708 RepID=A0A0A9B5V0_ARUDO